MDIEDNTSLTKFDDKTCAFCLEDLTLEIFVEYRIDVDSKWMPFEYCKDCLDRLMEMQWNIYIKGLKNADCEASLRNLINAGPPVNFRDSRIEEGKELHQFLCNSNISSAKLTDSFDPEKRDLLANKLKTILPLLGSQIKQNNSVDDVTDAFEEFDYIESINKILGEFSL